MAQRRLIFRRQRRLLRQRQERASPNTETARPARGAARRTCWKRSACASISRSNGMGARSGRLASVSCLRRRRTNPAGAQAQVLGVFSAEVIDLVAATLAELGVERAFVVHGAGGLDEISLAGETLVAEVRDGTVRRFTVTPDEFGVARAPLESLRGGSAAENAAIIHRVLAGEGGPSLDIVVINAAAALVAAGRAANLRDAANLAAKTISSGAAAERLAALVAFTNAG